MRIYPKPSARAAAVCIHPSESNGWVAKGGRICGEPTLGHVRAGIYPSEVEVRVEIRGRRPKHRVAAHCDGATLPIVPEIVSRKALEDLRGKYLEILSMRVAHHSAEQDAGSVRTRMAELASRFPGALRELDDLELDEIRRRTAALDVVLCQGSAVERWMEATVLFHALARGALFAKRWLLGRKRVDVEVERAYAAAVTALAFPDDARAWALDLARVASPPRRRLTNAVFERLAGSLGTTEREAKLLVFGASRRERRAGSHG